MEYRTLSGEDENVAVGVCEGALFFERMREYGFVPMCGCGLTCACGMGPAGRSAVDRLRGTVFSIECPCSLPACSCTLYTLGHAFSFESCGGGGGFDNKAGRNLCRCSGLLSSYIQNLHTHTTFTPQANVHTKVLTITDAVLQDICPRAMLLPVFRFWAIAYIQTSELTP